MQNGIRTGNQPAPYRPSAPEMPKKSRKMSPGASGLGPPTKSPKSPEEVQKHPPNTFWTLSGDFPDGPRNFLETFSGRLAGGIFETFSAFRARRARETPLRGGLVPKIRIKNILICGLGWLGGVFLLVAFPRAPTFELHELYS